MSLSKICWWYMYKGLKLISFIHKAVHVRPLILEKKIEYFKHFTLSLKFSRVEPKSTKANQFTNNSNKDNIFSQYKFFVAFSQKKVK